MLNLLCRANLSFAQWNVFPLRCQPPSEVNLLGLGTILVLPMARVHLSMLQKQGAKYVLPNRAGYILGPFGPRSLQPETTQW